MRLVVSKLIILFLIGIIALQFIFKNTGWLAFAGVREQGPVLIKHKEFHIISSGRFVIVIKNSKANSDQLSIAEIGPSKIRYNKLRYTIIDQQGQDRVTLDSMPIPSRRSLDQIAACFECSVGESKHNKSNIQFFKVKYLSNQDDLCQWLLLGNTYAISINITNIDDIVYANIL